MVKLDALTSRVVTDTTTQRTSRSSTLSGILIEEGVVAVESGSSLEMGHSFRKGLENHFNLPVVRLFLTHTHSDHRNGMMAFSDSILTLSSKCLGNMPSSVRLGRWKVETFEQELKLGEKSQVEFFHVGGHTVGSSVTYIPEDRVLIGGDLIFERSVNFGLPVLVFYQNKPKRDGNPEEYITAFKLFKRMKIDIIVPGHGNLIRDAQRHLTEQIKFFEDLRTFILAEISEGKGVEEITLPQLDPISQAYSDLNRYENHSAAKRWLLSYLDKLKKSFYIYYSTHPSIQQ
ncbi:MAG: MBL fold metallo-hydrolase [Candidatus Thorarchaeota archaeon]